MKEKNAAMAERVSNLQESLRLTIYTWVCRGLFEKDKLVLLCQVGFSFAVLCWPSVLVVATYFYIAAHVNAVCMRHLALTIRDDLV